MSDSNSTVDMQNYIGHRAKVGVIIPSTNTAVEYDLQRLTAAGLRGVTWHPARFFVEHTDLSDDDNFIHFLKQPIIGISVNQVNNFLWEEAMFAVIPEAETFVGSKESVFA